jgi:Na+/H+-dicarboxylate symporter
MLRCVTESYKNRLKSWEICYNRKIYIKTMWLSLKASIISRLKFPMIILSVLLMPLFLGHIVPVEIKSISLAVSLAIKSALIFILPFIIFSFLFSSLISLRAGAITFIILLLSMVYTSNFIAILTGYTIGFNAIPLLDIKLDIPQDVAKLLPMWQVNVPQLISNEPAMVMGILLGIFFAIYRNNRAEKIAYKLNRASLFILRKMFLPILPIFILGFVFKLEHEELLGLVLSKYLNVFLLVVSSQILYTLCFYMFAAQFSVKKFWRYMTNILPATLTGLSTISSAATMPVTIMCTEKNLNNVAMARTIIPATANIHTLGSAFGVTILAFGTMSAFGMPLPVISDFIVFAIYYALAKFAVAGIPGGVIIVVAPLLESHLGFSSEMIGIITALYILFDPFGTATNVTCNGAFAIIFTRVYKFFGKTIEDAEVTKVSHV